MEKSIYYNTKGAYYVNQHWKGTYKTFPFVSVSRWSEKFEKA